MSMLDEILDNKRAEVAEREARIPLEKAQERAERAPRPRKIDIPPALGLIAEVKRRSPSAGLIKELEPAEQAGLYAEGGASAISVLTDQEFFGGSFRDLEAVRNCVDVPVLCKDFILSPYQVYEARSHGADLLLLIVTALDDRELSQLHALTLSLGMEPLVEVHDQHDLARAIAIDAGVIGINNRDLDDFSVDLVTTEYLAPLVPDDTLLVSESGIATREDVERARRAGAHFVLVGEALLRAADTVSFMHELVT